MSPPPHRGSASLDSERTRSVERGDRYFHWSMTAAASVMFVIIGSIALFLAVRAWPAVREMGFAFFGNKDWFPDAVPAHFGIAALAFGSVISSVVALVIALPVALGTALFLVELAPPRAGRWIGYLVDLLAAVPSVVYGLWGVFFLVPNLVPIERWLDHWLGWIPLFHSRAGSYGRSLFAASVILAIMVLPIIAALAREIFGQVPRANREAALALGATRWEVMRLAVLPYGRSGIIGAAMLGIGRALGETIAVALVLAAAFTTNIHILEPGGNTIAANIATKFGESGVLGRDALIASGLVLFAITLIVNGLARAIVYRGQFTSRRKS